MNIMSLSNLFPKPGVGFDPLTASFLKSVPLDLKAIDQDSNRILDFGFWIKIFVHIQNQRFQASA